MKKLYIILALVAISVAQAWAQTFTVNNVVYQVIDDNSVTVTGLTTNMYGAFTVPGYVSNGGKEYKVKSVTEYSIFTNDNVNSLTFESGVSEIQQYAIGYCPRLQTLVLPKSLRTLAASSLARNTALESLAFPEGLERIESYTCMGNSSMTRVSISSTVAYIGKQVFKECPLTDVYCWATAAPWINPNAIDNFEGVTLHVLPGYGEVYKNAESWSQCNIVEDCGIVPDGIARAATSEKCASGTFDLQGRSVRNAATRGLLISGGQKVMK